jgi:alpha-tubulin suppressor-like RCC1 family protein
MVGSLPMPAPWGLACKARLMVRRVTGVSRGRVARLLVVVSAGGMFGVTPSPAFGPGASPGQLYAFGLNDAGQLGDTTQNGTFEPNPTPALVSLPGATGSVVQVAASAPQSLAVTSTGQLYAFGENDYGELGTTTHSGTNEPNPTPALVSLPGATGGVVQVAAGDNHSLAVTSSGQLYAFGGNDFGQLGIAKHNGTGEPNPTPALVSLPGATGGVVQVAAGDDDSFAVTSTGQLYAFGGNDDGQLGSTTHNGTNEPNPIPALVSLPGATGGVVQVATGYNHSLAVTSTGQLYAFGGNDDGQLGSTTHNGTNEPNPIPALVSLPGATGGVVQVAAGDDDSLAVTSTGQLYAFGLNDFGQLGSTTHNGTNEPNPTPALVSLPGATGSVVQIASGDDDSLVVTSTGQLYAFGGNGLGQLGITTHSGTEEPNPTPALVGLPGGATVDTIGRGSGAAAGLVVVANLAVSTAALPAGTRGSPYAAQVSADGGQRPYTWSASGLPTGLAIDAEGLVSGTPTQSGTFEPTVTVSDPDGIEASITPALTVGTQTIAKPASGTEVAPDVANATVFALFSSAAPVLSGSAIVGRKLTSSPGVWSGSLESFSFHWQRCSVAGGGCVSIPGAAEASYSVTRADLGRRLRALVTASNGARSASAASGVSRIVGGVVKSKITWEFGYTRRYTRVAKLLLRRLPVGASIEVRCIGDGCPFTRVRCATAGCRPRGSAKHSSELSLTSLFTGRRLAPGAEITVTVTVPNWIARQFTFTAHAGTAPSVQPQCLPPGSTTPRTHC